jgi:hypothetical protein
MTTIGPGPIRELDVRFLLDHRSQVQELLSATPRDRIDPGVVTLSLLSTRDEIWGVHVLAVAVALREGTSPLQMLERFARGDVGPIYDYVPADWNSEGLEDFGTSAQFVQNLFTADALAAAAASIPKLEECLKQDGPREQILRCLRGR